MVDQPLAEFDCLANRCLVDLGAAPGVLGSSVCSTRASEQCLEGRSWQVVVVTAVHDRPAAAAAAVVVENSSEEAAFEIAAEELRHGYHY